MAETPKGTFSVASTVEDPITAEALVETLQEKSIDAFLRPRGSAGTDSLGAATTGFGYFEILVPTPSVDEAVKLIEAELESIESEADANAAAAEEEALSGETKLPE
jgi:hypothetical protein